MINLETWQGDKSDRLKALLKCFNATKLTVQVLAYFKPREQLRIQIVAQKFYTHFVPISLPIVPDSFLRKKVNGMLSSIPDNASPEAIKTFKQSILSLNHFTARSLESGVSAPLLDSGHVEFRQHIDKYDIIHCGTF